MVRWVALGLHVHVLPPEQLYCWGAPEQGTQSRAVPVDMCFTASIKNVWMWSRFLMEDSSRSPCWKKRFKLTEHANDLCTVYFKGRLPEFIIALNWKIHDKSQLGGHFQMWKHGCVLNDNSKFNVKHWAVAPSGWEVYIERPLQLTYRRDGGKISRGINEGDAAEGLFIQSLHVHLYTQPETHTSGWHVVKS